jgi:RND family efflux transporter MFP subunit
MRISLLSFPPRPTSSGALMMEKDRNQKIWLRNIGSRSGHAGVGGLGLLGIAFLGVVASPVRSQPPREAPPAPVTVAEVVQRQVHLSETFVGTVMPIRRSTVGSEVEGRVDEFFVNEGDRTTAGQPLARLRTTMVDLERKAAEAELEFRRAALNELERSAPKEIEQAAARMESAEAQVGFNEKRLERFRDLYRRQALSDDELEEQAYAAELARKTFAEAKSAWELAKSGVWDARIEQSEARVRIQQETIKMLEDTIRQHTIEAPFDGYVTQEHVEVGQWVAKGGPVVEMVELDEVDVEVHVLERYIGQLRVGLPARVQLEALPDFASEGRVVLIVPQGDVRSRSFPVKVRMQNLPVDDQSNVPGIAMKPGMFARVSLPVGKREAATMVPKDALVFAGDAHVVWVVTEDPQRPHQGTAAPMPVELGVAYDDLIEVHGSLRPGQWIVMEGNERIRPGQILALDRRAKAIPSSSRDPAPDSNPPAGRTSGRPTAGP